MKEAPGPPKRRFLQEPHGVTTQKTPFFVSIVILPIDDDDVRFDVL
jgi:hypothetical protein